MKIDRKNLKKTFMGSLRFHLILILLFAFQLNAQDKGDTSKLTKPSFSFFLNRTGVHTGNLIRSAYSNFGNIGSRTLAEARMEWPAGSGVTYGFEFIFWVASEVVTDNGDTLHIISDRYTGGSRDVPSPEDHNWGWEPLPGYFNDGEITLGVDEDINGNGILDEGEDLNNNGELDRQLINKVEFPAMSHLPETWPFDWPDGSFPGEAGTRRNKWNGLFGAFVRADQESYYVIDDRSNDEFPYFPFDDPTPFLQGGSQGVGLQVEVRNFQWSNPLAEDILISIYQIKNVSGKPLNKNIVGMYIDADVGRGDSEDDISDFDIDDDITFQWDLDGLDLQGRKTGYFGFAFLQSPGLIDGLDNDGDGLIDESQEDGIDNDGDWVSFTDSDGSGTWDFEDLNLNGVLDTGEDLNGNGNLDVEDLNDDVGSDGLGPFDPGYPGPDPDGTEGNGIHDLGEPNFEFTDNDEIDQIGLTSFFGGGTGGNFVPRDDEDYWQTKIVPGTFNEPKFGFDISFTYGSGFFDIQPGATESFAIANLFGNDFEDILRNKRTMQRIYDSDFNFVKPPINSTLKATAGDGKVFLLWDNAAERSRDPIYGNDFGMYKIYRSTDPFFNSIKTITDAFGNALLWEPIAQFDKIDGLVGPHPIPLEGLGISYDMGDDTGLKHSFIDTTVDNGRTYYYAVVSVDLGYDIDFFDRGISDKEFLEPISPTESRKRIEVDILGNVISLERNVAVVVPREPAAGNQAPVFESGIEHIEGAATGSVIVKIVDPNDIENRNYEIFFTDDSTLEHLTTEYTIIDQVSGEILLTGGADQFDSGELEIVVVDGLKFDFVNDAAAEIVSIEWTGKTNLDVTEGVPVVRAPFDFEIRIFDDFADTSFSSFAAFRIPVKFQVWNTTDDLKLEFLFVETGSVKDSTLSVGDEITIIAERLGSRNITTTWKINFDIVTGLDPVLPKQGDKLVVKTIKPFSSRDIYEFSMRGWEESAPKTENVLDNIFVVPDPYVAVNSLERKQAAALTGRGERRIDFVNLPIECTIRIFTVSGKLVQVIEHVGFRDNGRESWDLTTSDGLEIAYGIYFFHVEAPGIGQKMGKFAIIK
ncbi:MAG: hypothetical protein IIB39_01555 [Candidatus Marinimicrobia bacterium]|nr:hypothetical protein [Candidatus Neomarinimicrobiota bacterium]